jgi:hypothetical protein
MSEKAPSGLERDKLLTFITDAKSGLAHMIRRDPGRKFPHILVEKNASESQISLAI